MDKCINTKHPEFIELAKQANMNPLVLKSKIGVWQEKNNSDDFPTLEELGKEQEEPNIGSDNNIKEGVSELFESNPELANIGTQEQYSQYLDTIFPDSKVKDIVYHGSFRKFDEFDESKIGTGTTSIEDSRLGKGFYFTKNINEAVDWATDFSAQYEGITVEEIANEGRLKQVVLNIYNDSDISGDEIVARKKEQIHILGSKQDIEGFKEFVNNRTSSLVSTAFQKEFMADLDLFCSYFSDSYPFQEFVKTHNGLVKLTKERRLSDNERLCNAYYSIDKKIIFVAKEATGKDLFSAVLEYYLLENEDIDVQDILFDMVDKINSRDDNFKVSSTDDIIHNLFINEKMKDFLKTQESTMEEYKNLFDEFISVIAEKGNLKKQGVLDILKRSSRVGVTDYFAAEKKLRDYPDVFSMEVLNNIEEC